MRIRSAWLPTISTTALLLLPIWARAAESAGETRLREALRSTTAQLRALEEERAKWQAGDAEQKKELESLRKQLAHCSKPAPRVGGGENAADLGRRLLEQTEANAKLTESLKQCNTSAETTRTKEAEQAKKAAEVAPLAERVGACEAKNARMYEVAKEILDRFAKSGGGEPFLGLAKVKLENAAQDYEDNLVEQKVKP